MHDMLGLNYRLARGYVEPRYGGRVTLFRVLHDGIGQEDDRRLRWADVAGGGLAVHDIEGEGIGHLTLLLEPHVRCLATELEAAIVAGLKTSSRA
jgi:hypothetical protein